MREAYKTRTERTVRDEEKKGVGRGRKINTQTFFINHMTPSHCLASGVPSPTLFPTARSHRDEAVTIKTETKIWSRAPDGARYQH